jgi:PAS domain S-box-containing protein
MKRQGVHNRVLQIAMRIVAAVVAVSVAIAADAAIYPVVHHHQFVFFALAVMLVSLYGGLWSGLLTTALSTLSINFFILDPPFSFDLQSEDFTRLALFTTVAGVISWLNGSRRKAEGRLRQSEEHFRSLVEGVSDVAIFMLDPQGKVLSWNASAERITGYASGEIVGKDFTCFFTSEDLRDGKPNRIRATAAASGRFEEEDWRVRRDGSRYWAGVLVTALRDGVGTLRGF